MMVAERRDLMVDTYSSPGHWLRLNRDGLHRQCLHSGSTGCGWLCRLAASGQNCGNRQKADGESQFAFHDGPQKYSGNRRCSKCRFIHAGSKWTQYGFVVARKTTMTQPLHSNSFRLQMTFGCPATANASKHSPER